MKVIFVPQGGARNRSSLFYLLCALRRGPEIAFASSGKGDPALSESPRSFYSVCFRCCEHPLHKIVGDI